MKGTALSRRALLAGGLGAVVTASAGCLRLGTASSDAERRLRLTLSSERGPLRDSFVVDRSRTRMERDEAAFEATLDGRTHTTQGYRPFASRPDDPKYTEHEGTYYRLGSVVVDEVEATHPVLRLYAVDDQTTDGGGAVAASSLPDADRRAVHIAHVAARARGNEGGVPWGLVQRGGYVYRSDSAVEASELLADGGPDRVTYRDHTYAVEITRETFHEPVYRATVDPVAESPERVEAILRAQFVDARISRHDISDAARDVLETATGEGYAETHPYTDGFREVLRALHERAYLDGDVERDAGVTDDGRRMIQYDGGYYDYRLRFTTAED